MKIRSIYYKIKHGIRNYWEYKSIIWNDRWWEHSYLYNLMEFKLRNMANKYKKYGKHVNVDRDIKNMLIAAELCKRISKANQCELDWENYEKNFNTTWKFEPCEDKPGLSKLVQEVIDPVRDAEAHRIMKQEEYLMNQDLELLGKILKDHSREWWD